MVKKKFSESVLLAMEGIAHGVSNERNMKIQGMLAVLVIIISLLLRIPMSDFVIILLVSFLVLICELMNTALEKLIDHIHPSRHDNIGRVKDMMAGAVLLSIILAVIVGIIILIGPIIQLLTF
jgi:undecaprenol kinase